MTSSDASILGLIVGAVIFTLVGVARSPHRPDTHHALCVAALAGRPPVEQVRLLAAFPECAPALADTTVTPRRGR